MLTMTDKAKPCLATRTASALVLLLLLPLSSVAETKARNGEECTFQENSFCQSNYCKDYSFTAANQYGSCQANNGASFTSRRCVTNESCNDGTGFCNANFYSDPNDENGVITVPYCAVSKVKNDCGIFTYSTDCANDVGYYCRGGYQGQDITYARCTTKEDGRGCTSSAQCTSGYCNTYGVCEGNVPAPPNASGDSKRAKRSRAAVNIQRSLCPGDTTACSISTGLGSGYECVNLQEELGHCGACGNDCEAQAAPGQGSVCAAGKCQFFKL